MHFKLSNDKKRKCTCGAWDCYEAYASGTGLKKTAEEILNDNVHILIKETYLQNKEVDELKKLIFTLGKSDIESQSRMIDLSIENLKNITGETKEDINQKGMVYRKLSTIIGLIIGIILI